MISKDPYTYPDRHDLITIALIDETEPYEGYWSKSENRILDLAAKEISKKQGRLKMLDAGCGLGRLSLRFSPLFTEIHAVEPDKERYDICRNNIQKWNLSDKVKLSNCTIETLEAEKEYDVILCSHVLQHVSEQKAEEILRSFGRMLKQDGILIITTTHSIDPQEIYCKSYFDQQGKRIEERIGYESFNKIESNRSVLPVRFFTESGIQKLLNKFDFEMESFQVYHNHKSVQLVDKVFGPDWIINLNEYLKARNGRDLYVCATPKRA